MQTKKESTPQRKLPPREARSERQRKRKLLFVREIAFTTKYPRKRPEKYRQDRRLSQKNVERKKSNKKKLPSLLLVCVPRHEVINGTKGHRKGWGGRKVEKEKEPAKSEKKEENRTGYI